MTGRVYANSVVDVELTVALDQLAALIGFIHRLHGDAMCIAFIQPALCIFHCQTLPT